MRVNFLCQNSIDDWSFSFAKGVCLGFFSYSDIDFHLIDNTGNTFEECVLQIESAPKCDVWFVARTTEWMLPLLFDRGECVVVHAHGGAETRQFSDTIHTDSITGKYFDQQFVYDKAAHVIVNSEKHKRDIVETYDVDNSKVHAFGFPLDLYRYKSDPKFKEDLILAPGRFSPEKNTVLLGEVLFDLRDRVVFSTPQNGDEGDYHCHAAKHLRRLGYRVEEGCVGESYLGFLRKAKVVVVAGMNETLNLCAVEGVLAGASVVAPKMTPYTEYLSVPEFYVPFCMNSIRSAVRNALEGFPRFSENTQVYKYDYRAYADKLLNLMSGLI